VHHLDENVDHLSAYDAIVIDPTWHAMFGVLDREAGTQVEEKARVHADPDDDHARASRPVSTRP